MHPYHEHRQTKKEHSRVSHITKGYKSGGAVKGEIGKKALALHKQEHAALHAEGDKSKHRMDRPKRAKGGSVKGKHNAKTIVNVISGGHPAGGVVPPGPPMAPPGPPMGIAPAAAPPMAARPPMPVPAGAGMPPGGPPMPMRARGGKIRKADGGGMSSADAMKRIEQATRSGIPTHEALDRIEQAVKQPMQPIQKARGGGVKHGPTWEEGRKNGTQVQHTDGKDDGKDIGRRRVVTFLAGGRVKKDCGGPAQTPTRAKGGRVGRDAVSPATKLPGGSGGGEARLAKAHRAERKG